jgi:hypothetical protein
MKSTQTSIKIIITLTLIAAASCTHDEPVAITSKPAITMPNPYILTEGANCVNYATKWLKNAEKKCNDLTGVMLTKVICSSQNYINNCLLDLAKSQQIWSTKCQANVAFKPKMAKCSLGSNMMCKPQEFIDEAFTGAVDHCNQMQANIRFIDHCGPINMSNTCLKTFMWLQNYFNSGICMTKKMHQIGLKDVPEDCNKKPVSPKCIAKANISLEDGRAACGKAQFKNKCKEYQRVVKCWGDNSTNYNYWVKKCGTSEGINHITPRLMGPPEGCNGSVDTEKCVAKAWKLIHAEQAACRAKASIIMWECPRFAANTKCFQGGSDIAKKFSKKCGQEIHMPLASIMPPPNCQNGSKGDWLGAEKKKESKNSVQRAKELLASHITECNNIRLTSKAEKCVIDRNINSCLLEGFKKQQELSESCKKNIDYKPKFIKRDPKCTFDCLAEAKSSLSALADHCKNRGDIVKKNKCGQAKAINKCLKYFSNVAKFWNSQCMEKILLTLPLEDVKAACAKPISDAQLKVKEFETGCHQIINAIYESKNETVYTKLVGEYNAYVAEFAKTHPKHPEF